MPKMLEMTCNAGPCGGRYTDGVTRPITAVATPDATLNRSDATLLELFEAGVLKALGLYRKLIDVEIGRASEHGARWWSRRLVEMYEEAGFVHLEN